MPSSVSHQVQHQSVSKLAFVVDPVLLPYLSLSRSYILDGGLPVIHNATVDQAIIRGRDLQDHGTSILSIEKRHEVDNVGVWRQRLVFPVK